ncbi:MAG: hypothetical protein ACK5OB_04630 [Pirellula sp.]
MPIAIAGIVAWVGPRQADAQVVQLPSMGTFSLSTTVAAPDRGSVFAGGNGGGANGSVSRGYGNTAIGSQKGASSVSVKTTVIDLDELDRMIRSQAGTKSTIPSLAQTDPRLHSRIPASPRGRIARPEYDYLAALSGHTGDAPNVSGYGATHTTYDREATKYYLERAHLAKQRGQWASVEMYYRLAWNSLPEQRRQAALSALSDARARMSEERVLSADQVRAKGKDSNDKTPRR